jgi:hypothetical protein
MTDLFDASGAPATEPTSIVSGDLVMWRRTDYAEYANVNHTLTYRFRPAAGGEVVSVTAAVVSGEFRITMSVAVTAAMAVGRWYWSAYIARVSDSARVQIADGQILVAANLAVDQGDLRSHARRMLDAIESVMEGRATDSVASYTIGGRQINKIAPDELIGWRNHYKTEVQAEEDADRLAQGLPARNTIRMRFV